MSVLEPYKHDCTACVWVGWIYVKGGGKHGSDWGNMYYCPQADGTKYGSVIIRFSDEGSDYWSNPIGACVKGGIRLDNDV